MRGSRRTSPLSLRQRTCWRTSRKACAPSGELVAPGPVRLIIAEQTGPKSGGPERPPHGLPRLKLPWNIRSPTVPQYLGWINHWSAAAAEAIGFPNPSRDADLLTRAQRTASGGWVVSLTATPLDLDKPEHLNALKRASERFPEIGGHSEA